MKRILLVADVHGWIFERHCLEIKKRLPEYRIDIAYCRDNVELLSKDYDLVYVLDPMPIRYPSPEKTIIGLRCEWLYLSHPGGAQGLYEKGIEGRCSSIKDKCCIFHVVNRRQLGVFTPIVTDKPLLLAQHGVDETCYVWDHQYPKHTKLVVGAVGRSNSDGVKGFDIIKEKCDLLGFEYRHAGYHGRRLTKEEMPAFYKDLDIFVSWSVTEGLCNPVLEAGAMGRLIVTTEAGAAPEIIEDSKNGIMTNWNNLTWGLQVMESALSLNNGEYAKHLSENMHKTIMDNWVWAVRIEDFRKMFNLFFEMHP
ncbi:MAG: glycosyltransferase [Methanomassiliicoccales archaeon]|jgi:glycosyltransferase involved in cell wall biosynthesis